MSISDFFAALFGRRRLPPRSRCRPETLAYGPDPQQYVTLYIPARRKSERVRVFLIVHGGGWWQGDADAPNVVDAKVGWLNPQGIALGSINLPPRHKVHAAHRPGHGSRRRGRRGRLLARARGRTRHRRRPHRAGRTLCRRPSERARHPRLGITVAGFVGLDSACYNVVQAMEGPHPKIRSASRSATTRRSGRNAARPRT